MATKLKNLKVTKVDFVDQGANPDAHIKLFKRNDDGSNPEPVTNEKDSEKNIWKRFVGALTKIAGMEPEEIDKAVTQIEKSGAETFSDKMYQRERRRIQDEIWDVCFALESALCSILMDEELEETEAATAMNQSLDDFYGLAKDSVEQWAGGKTAGISKNTEEITAEELEVVKSAQGRLTEIIQKAGVQLPGDVAKNGPKGEEEEMRIDKSKMTPEEKIAYESLVEKYKIDETDGVSKKGKAGTTEKIDEEDVIDEGDGQKTTKTKKSKGGEEDSESILKGVVADLRKEIETLKENSMTRELEGVAKKYEALGKKPEEMVETLKKAKKAGVYDDVIAAYDSALSAQETSGMFTEIGKSGHGAGGSVQNGDSIEAKINSIAKKYVEENPGMSHVAAVAKAWEDNPDLMDEYEESAGF